MPRNTSRSKPPAVVVGLNINGLATVRALGRRGVPVTALAVGDGSPPESTRYCRKVVCPQMASSEEALVNCLLEVGRRMEQKAVLFVSGDLYLKTVSDHRAALADYYHFTCADQQTVNLLLHKVEFYRFAQEHGFPIARTYFPESMEDVRQISREIRYPCLLKPSIATPEWRRHGLKLLAAAAPEQLVEQYAMASAIYDRFVIQEVTPGPDSALSFSLTYYGREGRPLAMFTGRKLRQYVPRFGISSLAQSWWDPRIASLTEAVLSAMNYRGYGSVEFKWDPERNEFQMTEVTGRTWYPHGLSERCGINLPYLAYRHLLGLPEEEAPRSFVNGMKWIDEWGDLRSAYQYWREGELTLREWMASYRGRRTYATLSVDDPVPGLRLVWQMAWAAAKKVVRGLLRLVRRNRPAVAASSEPSPRPR